VNTDLCLDVHTMALRNEHLLSLLSTLESSCTRTEAPLTAGERPPQPHLLLSVGEGGRGASWHDHLTKEVEGQRGTTIR
jgi:hypothetical protein